MSEIGEFIECRYCEYQCKYRSIAEKNMKADEEYTKTFFDLFREGDLDAVAEHIASETIKIMETKNPDSLLALGLCLYVIGTNILEIPDVLRRRLGRLAKSKIRNAIKDQLGITAPAVAKKVVVQKAPATAAQAAPSTAPEAVTAEKTMEFPEVEEVVPSVSPANVISQWLQSDPDYMYYVDQIIQRSDDMVNVKYDLETEGFLTEVFIKAIYANVDEKGDLAMKIAVKGTIEAPYHLNMIIGKVKNKVIATSIPGDLKDEATMYKNLEEIDTKEGLVQTDRLTLLLNKDKILTKTIGKALILKSPDETRARSIKVPITVQKKGAGGCDLVVKTFFSPRLSPMDIFVNIMDGIAEHMEYLLELPQKEREEVPMAKDDWFTIKVKPKMGSFSSKFIKRVALPDIPTCPHCDRPLPKASSTDYRRCPFCYEKL